MTERRNVTRRTGKTAMVLPLALGIVAIAMVMSAMTSSPLSTAVVQAYNIPRVSNTPKGLSNRAAASATTFLEMVNYEQPDPSTFREAEILGLRLMQEGNFAEALVGTFRNFEACDE